MTAESGIRNPARTRWALTVGIAAILLATLLGASIMLLNDGEPTAADAAWLQFLVSTRDSFTLALAYFLNAFGGGVMGILVVPLAIVAFLLIVRRPVGAAFSVAAALASTLIVQILKNIFDRARPEDILVIADHGSFPSGHVANAATIAVTFAVLFPRVWVRVVGVVYVLLMAWSRALLGAHWLTDTLGGALIGAGTVLVLWVIAAPWLEAERQRLLQRSQQPGSNGSVPIAGGTDSSPEAADS